eukprot:TRINITY_DN831_c0_g1_i2.p1 TRINITY_DN831_c0_g1~~TRINITY_DN831_c0_g1_i2.p1  ORF type:complete len:278 (-),score=96.00 TRINITY_DN831_c0_g1_i2:60-860(-)
MKRNRNLYSEVLQCKADDIDRLVMCSLTMRNRFSHQTRTKQSMRLHGIAMVNDMIEIAEIILSLVSVHSEAAVIQLHNLQNIKSTLEDHGKVRLARIAAQKLSDEEVRERAAKLLRQLLDKIEGEDDEEGTDVAEMVVMRLGVFVDRGDGPAGYVRERNQIWEEQKRFQRKQKQLRYQQHRNQGYHKKARTYSTRFKSKNYNNSNYSNKNYSYNNNYEKKPYKNYSNNKKHYSNNYQKKPYKHSNYSNYSNNSNNSNNKNSYNSDE